MSPFRSSFPPQPSVFSRPPLVLQPNFCAPGASSFLSMICRLLGSLCSLFRARFLCFHQLAASFCGIPGGGVGIPIRSLDSRRESTKTPGAGDASTGHPGWGVPEHIRAMRSFPRRMHNVALLSPVASLDCAYFLSPRGVPNALSAFPANPIGSPLTRFVHPRNTAFHVGVSV